MARTKTPTAATCEWAEEGSEHGDYWDTACGEAFTFMEGGPRENKMLFCPYCGRILKSREARR